MANWSDVTKLTESNDDLVKETATKLAGYKTSLDAGSITQSEFQDLSKDLLNQQVIADAALEQEQEIVVKEAFDLMVQVAAVAM